MEDAVTESGCRLRADEWELLSKVATDRKMKSDWSRLSVEWHNVARRLALDQGDLIVDKHDDFGLVVSFAK
jgi:hypothetical protein